MARSAYMMSPSSPPASASSSKAATFASSARCSTRKSACVLLRAGLLGVIRPVLLRTFDVATLPSLVAATQQDDQSVSDAPEIDSITWPNVDPKLCTPSPTDLQSPNSPLRIRPMRSRIADCCPPVLQCGQPVAEHIPSRWRQIVPDLEFGHCSLSATCNQEEGVALRRGTTFAPSRAASSCRSYHAISARRISSCLARS